MQLCQLDLVPHIDLGGCLRTGRGRRDVLHVADSEVLDSSNAMKGETLFAFMKVHSITGARPGSQPVELNVSDSCQSQSSRNRSDIGLTHIPADYVCGKTTGRYSLVSVRRVLVCYHIPDVSRAEGTRLPAKAQVNGGAWIGEEKCHKRLATDKLRVCSARNPDLGGDADKRPMRLDRSANLLIRVDASPCQTYS